MDDFKILSSKLARVTSERGSRFAFSSSPIARKSEGLLIIFAGSD